MNRLETAAAWLDSDDILADIGCDHGYLAIYAINKGVKHVQLVDNKKGPLDVAYKNMEEAGYQSEVTFTLSDGLSALEEDVNAVSILGMGGDLISKILEDGKNKISNVNKFILGANTKVTSLRRYLNDNNYTIVDEVIVKEKNKYYELIKTIKALNSKKLSDLDIMMGPILRIKKDAIFLEKWQGVYQNYQKIIDKKDVTDIKKKMKLIEEVLW